MMTALIHSGFFSSMILLIVVGVRFFNQSPVFGEVEVSKLERQVQQSITPELKKEKRIDRLISGAERAFSNANYTLPEGESAYAYYQQVLKLQADNLAAQDGLKNIENELL
ncbi:hypothetical protein MNBD_GAMMA10-1524, partial [hydrothermal vent metagenome]